MDTELKVNPITLQVGLESADLVHRFSTLSHGEEHLGEDYCKSFKGLKRY